MFERVAGAHLSERNVERREFREREREREREGEKERGRES